MNKRFWVALSFLLVLALAPMPAMAVDEGQAVKGAAGPAQGTIPSIAKPTPASSQAISTEEKKSAEEHIPGPKTEHSTAETQRRKSLSLQTNLKTGGKEIHLDSTPTPLAPNVGTNFGGLGQNGWIPYDAAIAVGPSHVVAMTNSQWIAYDRAGAVVRAVTGFGVWWGTPAGTPFDPKCFYDPVGGRFVMMAVSQTKTGGSKAFYHLSISQTGDPTGSWYNYQFDATMDGTTSTSNWADFPGLGYDDNAIYITSNQFAFSGAGFFQYAKIRVLSKSQLYAGSAATFTDFVGSALRNSDNSQAFTVQPARTLSSTASEYFLNTNSNSNNTVTLWRVDGAPASPSLVRQATYSVGTFTYPPDAPQKGSATLVKTNDDRMYDIVWRNGIIHAAFGEGFNGLAAARYLRLDTTSNTVLKDATYTQPGVHYFFPAVTDDSAGNLYMIFSRSGSSEFASVYQTGMTPADSAIEPSVLVKAGVAANTSGRWGDYSAIVNDPADSLAVVSYAGWANTSNRWATWITGMTFSGSTPTPTLLSVNPSSGIQGANVNVTLTGQNTNWVQGTSAIGISGSGVTASSVVVASATSMTATFDITAGAATGTRNVTVTTGTEVTTSAPFTVNASTPAPVLNPLTPNRGNQGQSVNVTLSGTNFVVGQTSINVGGTGVTATNLNVTSSTQATVTMVIAANAAIGSYVVTLSTSGGTSNTRYFSVFGVPFIAMLSPANGNPGTSPTVTFTGTNFLGGQASVSGGGITLSNRTINGTWTQLTYTFAISSGAAPGARSVTVTSPAGPSNAVTFNVGSAPATPTLASVNPNNGNPGQTVNVTLTGTNFLTGATVNVSGAGVAAGNVVVVNTTTITADLTISAAAAAGARDVSVTTGGGTSATQIFTVNSSTAAPVLNIVSPNSGMQGTAVDVTLAGTGFIAGSTIGLSGSGITVSNLVVVSSTSITATFSIAGSAPTGAQNVTVSNSNGTSNAQTFTVSAAPVPPTLTQVSPASGMQGTAVDVTLTGAGFIAGSTIGLSGSGITVSNLVVASSTSITATFTIAGSAPTGAQNVTVSNSDGTSNAQAFTVSAPPAPTLNPLSPNKGQQGAALTVNFTGTNFVPGFTTLSTNAPGVAISNLNISSSTAGSATFTLAPNATTNDWQVTLTTPGGTSNVRFFTVYGIPTLTSISPSSGVRSTSFKVTIVGTQLILAQPQFSCSGITPSNRVANSTYTQVTYTFTISSSAPVGACALTFFNAAGTSNALTFTVN